MWKCHKCFKPVYFAERRQSLGFDWHPWCLKCEECGKVLNPGQHAEHKSTPYCHIPCYSALFGPKLFGHGSRVESHQSFGKRSASFIREQSSMERKVKEYNAYLDPKDARLAISHREVNGRLVLYGVLRVFWGVDHSIRLKEFDDKRLVSKGQNAKNRAERDRKAMSMVTVYQFENSEASTEDDDDDDEDNLDTAEDANSSCNMTTLQMLKPSLSNGDKEAASNLDKITSSNLVKFASPAANKAKKQVRDGAKPEMGLDVKPEVAFDAKQLQDRRTSLEPEMLQAKPETSAAFARVDTKYKTLPAKFKKREHDWDEIDELLMVERPRDETDRVYHTVCATLPKTSLHQNQFGPSGEPVRPGLNRFLDSEDIPGTLIEAEQTRMNTLEQLFQQKSAQVKKTVERANGLDEGPQPNVQPPVEDTVSKANTKYQEPGDQPGPVDDHAEQKENLPPSTSTSTEISEDKIVRGKGPRALRRRHGKRMDRAKLRRRSSINGHWYDRDTSVFTPPKGSSMSVSVNSLLGTQEVIKQLLEKYQVESEANQFALYVVKETGERRLVTDQELPLLLRVNLGPHESINKLFLHDRSQTKEIKHEVAQYLKFSYAECRAILNMFYEEEEKEVEKIQRRYKKMKQELRDRLAQLKVKF